MKNNLKKKKKLFIYIYNFRKVGTKIDKYLF